MARRPFDPADAQGWKQDRVPPGRRARPRVGRSPSWPTPTSSCTWRSSSSAARGRAARSTWRARATCSRRPRPARKPAGVRVVGRRLRLPRRQAAQPAHRGRPRRAGRGPLLLARRRPSWRACSPRSLPARRSRPTCFRPCIVAGPEAPLLIRNLPYVQIAGRLPDPVRCAAAPRCRSSSRCSPTRASPSSSSTPTTSRPRCVAGTEGRGRAGAYNLAAPGTADDGRRRRGDGLVLDPDPRAGVDATAEVASRLPFLPPEAAWLQAAAHPGADGHA